MVDGAASRDGLGNEVFDVQCCYCDTRLRAPWVRPRPPTPRTQTPLLMHVRNKLARSGSVLTGPRMSRSVRPARRRLHRALCACAPARPRASLPGPPRYIPALTGSLAQVGTGIVRCGKCKELLQIKRPPCKHGTMRTGLGGYQACPHWRARAGSAIASTSFPVYAHVHACMFPHPSPTARCGVAAPHSAGRRGAHVTLPKPLAETLNWQDPTQCFCERLFKCCPTASAFYLAILTTSFIIGTGFVRCVCVCACVRVRACVRVETYMAGQPSGIMPLYARACKHTRTHAH